MDRNALAELLQALESRRDAEERRREERYTALIERFSFWSEEEEDGEEELQKRQQLQQHKRWWSQVPTQFGPPDWATEQEQWRMEGAPMCGTCGKFSHDREDCPYVDPQYEEAWNQSLVGDAAEWFWAVDQTQLRSTAQEREAPRSTVQACWSQHHHQR
ncbi:UNVERIFIED_CONTAM: hypothetical protein FKN15_037327 [Acipenser sinensis]